MPAVLQKGKTLHDAAPASSFHHIFWNIFHLSLSRTSRTHTTRCLTDTCTTVILFLVNGINI